MSFFIRECTEEKGSVGKYKDRCGGLRKDQDALLMFYLYTRTYGLFSFREERERSTKCPGSA